MNIFGTDNISIQVRRTVGTTGAPQECVRINSYSDLNSSDVRIHIMKTVDWFSQIWRRVERSGAGKIDFPVKSILAAR